MKKDIKKPNSAKVVIGIFLMVIGFGGIGYVPGKPMYFNVVFAVLMIIGGTLHLLYMEDKRLYRQLCREINEKFRARKNRTVFQDLSSGRKQQGAA